LKRERSGDGGAAGGSSKGRKLKQRDALELATVSGKGVERPLQVNDLRSGCKSAEALYLTLGKGEKAR